jgi:NADH dehydrogenase/NADH:ubiquinone oxidoreductase subunit G
LEAELGLLAGKFEFQAALGEASALSLELLLSEHDGDCQTCSRSSDCELRCLSIAMGIDEITYTGQRTLRIIDNSTPALVRDTGLCVSCRRCVTVCNEIQGVGALFPQGRGFATLIGPAFAGNPPGAGSCAGPRRSPRLPSRVAELRRPAGMGARRAPMGVIIIREMVGTSPRSWSDAARQAVATASRTVRNIRTVEVVKSTAAVEDGEIVEYRVNLKIGFEYEGA